MTEPLDEQLSIEVHGVFHVTLTTDNSLRNPAVETVGDLFCIGMTFSNARLEQPGLSNGAKRSLRMRDDFTIRERSRFHAQCVAVSRPRC